MEEEKQQQPGNGAGPSSAVPETQPGLQETIQSGEKIIDGARTEDQLDRLKNAAQQPSDEEANDEQPKDAGNGNQSEATLW